MVYTLQNTGHVVVHTIRQYICWNLMLLSPILLQSFRHFGFPTVLKTITKMWNIIPVIPNEWSKVYPKACFHAFASHATKQVNVFLGGIADEKVPYGLQSQFRLWLEKNKEIYLTGNGELDEKCAINCARPVGSGPQEQSPLHVQVLTKINKAWYRDPLHSQPYDRMKQLDVDVSPPARATHLNQCN